jgi:hypothetical protein
LSTPAYRADDHSGRGTLTVALDNTSGVIAVAPAGNFDTQTHAATARFRHRPAGRQIILVVPMDFDNLAPLPLHANLRNLTRGVG